MRVKTKTKHFNAPLLVGCSIISFIIPHTVFFFPQTDSVDSVALISPTVGSGVCSSDQCRYFSCICCNENRVNLYEQWALWVYVQDLRL